MAIFGNAAKVDPPYNAADWPLREFTVVFRSGKQLRLRGGWIAFTATHVELVAYSDRNIKHTVGVFPLDMLEMIFASDNLVDGPA